MPEPFPFDVTAAGVDGCRGGWCVVATDGKIWDVRVLPDAAAVADVLRTAACVLIDLPIGLPSVAARVCDRLVRRELGPRRSSVFAPPARLALSATEYASACAINQRLMGKKFSIQAWHLVPRIREVDRLLQRRPALRSVWRESHPEAAFSRVAGRPLVDPKRTQAGQLARRALLADTAPALLPALDRAIRAHPRRVLAIDDVYDAAILALAAAHRLGPLESLPPSPPLDDAGLPMRIVLPAGRA